MKLTRTFSLTKDNLKTLDDGQEAISIAISTESPYRRYRLNGHKEAYEVLGHTPEEIDLSYIIDGAPFLFEHKTDVQVGVLRNVRIDEDYVLRADVVFSNSQFAQEIKADMSMGIRTRISVGYEVLEYSDVGTAEDGLPIVRATRWVPFESSTVAIPADLTAGVSKSMTKKNLKELIEDFSDEEKAELLEALEASEKEASPVLEELVAALTDELVAEDAKEEDVEEEKEEEVEEEVVEESTDEVEETEEVEEDDEDVKSILMSNNTKAGKKAINKEHRNMSVKRTGADKEETSKIVDLATRHGMTDKLSTWLSEGASYNDVAAEILDSRSNSTKVSGPSLSKRENRDYSLVRGIEALLSGDNSIVAEYGRDIAMRNGIAPKSNAIYIPTNMPLFRNHSTTGTGASLVANEYLTFEQALYEHTLIGALGVQVVEGVANQLVMPRGDVLTGAWVSEEGTITNTSQSFSTVTWSPKTYAVTVPYTRQLNVLSGNYAVEDIVRNDIMLSFAQAAEAGVLAGSGSAQPSGIVYDSGVPETLTTGSVSLATFSNMWQTQRENKGSTDGVFVVTPGVYAEALATAQFTNTGPAIVQDGKILGFNTFTSNHLPTDLASSGNRHGALYGNFNRVLAAHFGVLELIRDDFTAAANGGIRLRGFMYMDSHARQPNDLVRSKGIIKS